MELYSSYSVKIKHYNHIFQETVRLYRDAVRFFLSVSLERWQEIARIKGATPRVTFVETLTVRTKKRPVVLYDFSVDFYKFPSYLRRAAISEALGMVSSYQSSLKNWLANPAGRKPSVPQPGMVSPALYHDKMYIRTGDYTAKVKVFLRNTWDWLTIALRKTDVDYILHHCTSRKECCPTLQKRGKQWFMDFPFKESVALGDKEIQDQTILSVDLGLNHACVCTAMAADGTVAGRYFLSLPAEKDSLRRALGQIRKAQQHGAKRMPRLWARAMGINHDIAVKTASFIMEKAVLHQADVVVFEYLDVKKKKRGPKKQQLHHWKCRTVQALVNGKAHRLGMRFARVCAWGTSALACDGSGRVVRDPDNHSLCTFPNGKRYHCDLSAACNIGARYFVREILKSLPGRERLALEGESGDHPDGLSERTLKRTWQRGGSGPCDAGRQVPPVREAHHLLPPYPAGQQRRERRTPQPGRPV